MVFYNTVTYRGEYMSGSPKFTVLHEKHRGKTFDLDKDVITIGRRDEMDICIKDPSMSGHHATLTRCEKDDGSIAYILTDNNSSNGTCVNNIPVTEQELQSSDLVLFGTVEVLYDSGADSGIGNTYATSTHTIDLTSIDSNMSTVPSVSSLNPFAETEAKRHKMTTILLVIAALLLGAGVLAVIAIAALKISAASA